MRESFFPNNSGRGTRKSHRQTGYSIPMAGWLCVSFVGLVAGYVAGIIDIGTGWLKDLKEGICPEAFYLNREQCCWSSNDTMLEMHNCAQWKTWPQLLGINSPDSYVGVFISYFIYVIFSVALAGLAALLVKTFAPYACGSGIPEIKSILSGFQIKGYLGKWTLIIKSICVSLVVASGMSLGKEGPLVHISCCIGNFFTHWPCFAKYGKDEAKKMEILSAASAAGVSVAFGAPIGGVLFSLEEVSNYFPLKTLWRSFFCALIAAFVLRSINPFGNEHLVKFYVDYTRPWVLFELIPFVFLGILGGILGTVLIKANIRWCRYRKDNKLGQYPITEVLVVATITALLAFPNEFTRMDSSDLIRLLFSQCGIVDFSDLCDYKRNFTNVNKKLLNNAEAGPGVYKSIYLLVLALIFKLVITVFTFGMKVPTGIFIPSMSLGAIMGRVIGIFMEQLAFRYPKLWFFQGACSTGVNCMTPGLYAMVGAAATLAGVTRMTVSLVVIMFELTGSVEFIVPLMSAVMASKWMGDALDKQGIYDAHIQLNGYPFLDSKEEYSSTTVAADCMKLTKAHQTPLILITQDAMTIEDLDNLLCNSNYNGYPVVVSPESQYLVGFVNRRELQSALSFAKRTNELYKNTRVIFYGDSENMVSGDGLPQPLNLRKIVDLSPITITDRTPMVTVIDMFRKLSLRQVLVTHNGRLLGIITKKDVLRHIKQLSNEDPDSILFN